MERGREQIKERQTRVQQYTQEEMEEQRLMAQLDGAPAKNARSTGAGAGGGFVRDLTRMVHGTKGGVGVNGSSMSHGALHDRLRRNMNSLQRSGEFMSRE